MIKYIILAIIQGLTEPLPISSSGHMILFQNLFETNMFNDLNFEIICNFGSFLAILAIFRKDILSLIKSFFNVLFGKQKKETSKKDFKYIMYLIVSTIPVMISGLLLKDTIESKLGKPIFLAISFLITAIFIFIVKNIKGEKDDYDISLKDAILIGLFQAITIMPGISRSGTVLVACLICKLKRETALKYTFMLYFPVSAGSMLLGTIDLLKTPNISSLLLPYTVGLIISLIITFFSYNWLTNWVKRGKLWYFSIYCLTLSIFILIFFR